MAGTTLAAYGGSPGHDDVVACGAIPEVETREALRLSVAVALVLLAQALDRDHLLVLGGVEHDHPLRRAAGDADAVDARADELPAVRHQHDLVALLHRER